MGFFKKISNGQIKKNQAESEIRLRTYAFQEINNLLTGLSASLAGLSSNEAEERQDEFGKNIITTGTKNTTLHRLSEAVINPFNLVLFAIAIITYFTDVIYSHEPNYLTVGIIISLIFISGIVAFVQGERSNAAAEKLSMMISNMTGILRDGELIEIPIEDVVPGDIVKLSAGDMIPADVRFLSTKDTFVAQAALTGESNPVEKFSDARSRSGPELGLGPGYGAGSGDSLTDLQNLGFMGSNIISGSATAVVLTIGNNTYIGSMAETIGSEKAKNSFERGVESVSGLLIRLMLVMIPVVFLINGIMKGAWADSLLFAIAIAVGLTPEMLPVIMTSTLAKGAVIMSRHQVIVKALGAIQAFGEMDILCTDKTGTLTEDRIVLEKYMNVLGEDDTRVLRHAYLNSHFQTGLKNLIDLAIINRALSYSMEEVLRPYVRVDEIPFDFSRRRMSVVLEDSAGKRQLITKGAVEEIISISAFVEWHGEVIPLTSDMKARVMMTYERYNADGLRMIAVAQKNEVPDVDEFCVDDESDVVLIGFVGFLDPPKESAATAITALKEHGVRTVVLTGDSEGVAIKVCKKVGVDTSRLFSGKDVEGMDDAALLEAVKICDLFAKLSPSQKERVVTAFQNNGHTVGYLGDGINDAPPLHQADVGISVDSAVDIAKETANIILLKKDLMVLEEGVIEGRHTFGNIVKYIKMAASGNFGNMISVLVASVFLPFLPMLPVHILAQNLLCDFSQMGMPFDNVDSEYIKRPRKWETGSIKSFMAYLGPLSSVFDIICFGVMWWIIGANSTGLAPLFQCGWFVFGTVSQVFIIHMIRTSKIPFLQSRPSAPLLISTLTVAVIALIVGFSSLASGIEMRALPLSFAPWLALILALYCLSAQFIKGIYVKRYAEWL